LGSLSATVSWGILSSFLTTITFGPLNLIALQLRLERAIRLTTVQLVIWDIPLLIGFI
jgi:hypothetical protein